MSDEVTVTVPSGYVGRRTFRLLDEAGVPASLTGSRVGLVVARMTDGYVVFRRDLTVLSGPGTDGYCTYTFSDEDWTDKALENDPYAKLLSRVVGTRYAMHFVQWDQQDDSILWTYPQDRPAVLAVGMFLRA